MAYSATLNSRGYDLSLFETSGSTAKKPEPKKVKKKQAKNNIVALHEITVEKGQRRKHNVGSLVLGFIMAGIITVIVGFMIHGQVQLAEINQQITTAQTELDHSKSEYVQMQARVEAFLSTSAVEKYASTQLGMTKATNQQKEYISLSQGDKAEIYTQSSDNIFTRIGDFFGSLWS